MNQFDSETKEAFTYVEVAEKMKSLAAGLQIKFNLALGERIAIALPLCMEYSIASLAVQLCGATAVLINPAQTICIWRFLICLMMIFIG